MSEPNSMTIEALASIMERLAEVIEAENALLAEARNAGMAELIEEKTKLASIYERACRNKEALADQPEEIKDILRALSMRLDTATTQNQRALRAAQEVNRRVTQLIAEAVQEQKTATSGYSRKGIVSSGYRSTATVSSIAFNKTM